MRSSVHPPATLECEQRRRPVMLLWLEGFSTILAALAMLLLRPASRCQVLLPLTARPACTQPSLTARCAPCAVGACLPLEGPSARFLRFAISERFVAVSYAPLVDLPGFTLEGLDLHLLTSVYS